MKIVILNGSPRANGNTAAMVEVRMSAQIQAAIQRFYVWGQHPTMKKGCLLLSSYSPDVYDGAVGEYRGILRYFGAADCGIVTSDNTTNKTETKLNECYELGRGLK